MGRLDVDAMLAEMTPEQFSGWWQYFRLRPWGGDWHRSSMQTARILNTVRGVAGAEMKEGDWLEDDAFVPAWVRPGEQHETGEVAKQLAAADSIDGLGV
jgi:hypothetical protein